MLSSKWKGTPCCRGKCWHGEPIRNTLCSWPVWQEQERDWICCVHCCAVNEKLLVKGPYHVQIPSTVNETAHKAPGLMSALSIYDTQQRLQGEAGNEGRASYTLLNLSAATLGSCSCTLLSIFRLSQRCLEQPTLQRDPSPAPRAHQGHLFPRGEPHHAQEHSGRWPQAPGGCRWEKMEPSALIAGAQEMPSSSQAQ